jgi:hypothetical protein
MEMIAASLSTWMILIAGGWAYWSHKTELRTGKTPRGNLLLALFMIACMGVPALLSGIYPFAMTLGLILMGTIFATVVPYFAVELLYPLLWGQKPDPQQEHSDSQ